MSTEAPRTIVESGPPISQKAQRTLEGLSLEKNKNLFRIIGFLFLATALRGDAIEPQPLTINGYHACTSKPVASGCFESFPGGKESATLESFLTCQPRELYYRTEDGTERPLSFGVFVDSAIIQIRGVIIEAPHLDEEEESVVLELVTYMPNGESSDREPLLIRLHIDNRQPDEVLMRTISGGVINRNGGQREDVFGYPVDLGRSLQSGDEVLVVFESQASRFGLEDELVDLAQAALRGKPLDDSKIDIGLENLSVVREGEEKS